MVSVIRLLGLFLSLSLSVLPVGSAHAQADIADGPEKLPTRSEVLTRFEDRFRAPIEKFFAERDTDSKLDECRKVLREKMDLYRAARDKHDYTEMESILVGDLIGETEEPSGLADLLQKCGPCKTEVRPLGGNVFESDGWCRGPKKDADAAKASYQKITKRLLNLETYPKNLGGFNYVLNFDGINEEGTPSSLTSSPFLVFIVVKGLFGTAFQYVAKNFHEEAEEKGVKSFVLQFDGVDFPAGFKAPKAIYDHPRKPTSSALKVFNLKDVTGQWFADWEGNFRYYTRAKFDLNGFPLPEEIATRFATRTHLDTLFAVLDSSAEGSKK